MGRNGWCLTRQTLSASPSGPENAPEYDGLFPPMFGFPDEAISRRSRGLYYQIESRR